MKNDGKFMHTKSILHIKFYYLFALLLLPLTGLAQQENLQSIVDRTNISVDETLVLTVRYTGQSLSGKPNFSQLNSHFDVLSSQQNSRRSIVNGRVTAYTDWILALAPKKEGTLIIPSFRLGSLISDAVEIKVGAAAPVPKGKVKEIFIETEISKQTAYVQEQLVLSYRLYFSRNVSSLEKPPIDLPKVLVEALPEKQYNRRIAGKLYAVAEYSFALFPQESGDFVIPAQRWTLIIPQGNNRSFMGFSSRSESIRRRTEEINVSINPRPSTFPHNHPWLPATDFTLEESWSADPNTMTLGEPITRTLTLNAQGLMASQLPQIWDAQENPAYKAYGDKPELSEEKHGQGFSATRIESTAVVMNATGESVLPAVKIPWWNTKTDSLQWVSIPERSIQINANASAPLSTPESTAPDVPSVSHDTNRVQLATAQLEAVETLHAQVKFWQIVSGILFFTTLGGFAWVYFTRYANKPQRTKTPLMTGGKRNPYFSKLINACQAGDAKKVRETLILWAGQFWPDANINNLDDITRRIDDETLVAELKALDASLYSENTDKPVDLIKIASLIKSVIEREKAKATPSALEPLYPA